jgi:hypothetical protein
MGKFYGGNFQAIQEYFQQKFCRFCSNPFTSEGIELLREEPGILVVRVGCSVCGRPLGVAIVGTGPKTGQTKQKSPFDWSKRDNEKFANQPAITYDDVLAAHEFFSGLGPDWSKHLPRTGRSTGS